MESHTKYLVVSSSQPPELVPNLRAKKMMDKHGERYPLGFGSPEDIANAIIFLLSDGSKWITGTEIKMDGGLTAGQ